jgi:hypothetical protein
MQVSYRPACTYISILLVQYYLALNYKISLCMTKRGTDNRSIRQINTLSTFFISPVHAISIFVKSYRITKTHQVVSSLFLFLCLAAADNGGRPIMPDVTGVLPRQFCPLNPEAGGRWPGTKPLPGARRRRAPSGDMVGDGLGVGVPCCWPWWSPSSISIVAICNSIS